MFAGIRNNQVDQEGIQNRFYGGPSYLGGKSLVEQAEVVLRAVFEAKLPKKNYFRNSAQDHFHSNPI